MRVFAGSVWRDTWTCFDLVQDLLRVHLPQRPWTVLVLGCADGKHAIPFLLAGHRVVAVDADHEAIHGSSSLCGLIANATGTGIAIDNLRTHVCDYMTFRASSEFDLVFTSCSWQYGFNRRYSIGAMVKHTQEFVRSGGMLVADYMQPLEPRHQMMERYITPTRLEALFDSEVWRILRNRDAGVRGERHIGVERWHEHRYAYVVALRNAPLSSSRE